MTLEETRTLIKWLHELGASHVRIGEVVVDFHGRPIPPRIQLPPPPRDPYEDDGKLSPEERDKFERELMMFRSSV